MLGLNLPRYININVSLFESFADGYVWVWVLFVVKKNGIIQQHLWSIEDGDGFLSKFWFLMANSLKLVLPNRLYISRRSIHSTCFSMSIVLNVLWADAIWHTTYTQNKRHIHITGGSRRDRNIRSMKLFVSPSSSSISSRSDAHIFALQSIDEQSLEGMAFARSLPEYTIK